MDSCLFAPRDKFFAIVLIYAVFRFSKIEVVSILFFASAYARWQVDVFVCYYIITAKKFAFVRIKSTSGKPAYVN